MCWWAVPTGSELNEGLGRAGVLEPLKTNTVLGFGEEWFWPNQESKWHRCEKWNENQRTSDGTTALEWSRAKATLGRCPAEGARAVDDADRS